MTVEEFDAAKVGDRIYTKTNKFVVVYRNKTKLYLKSSGTDLLIFFGPWLFYSEELRSYTEGYG